MGRVSRKGAELIALEAEGALIQVLDSYSEGLQCSRSSHGIGVTIWLPAVPGIPTGMGDRGKELGQR